MVILIYIFSYTVTVLALPNTWTQKADFGGTAATARIDSISFSIGSKGYVGMGFDGSTYYKDFWEYDPTTNIWTQKADFGGATGRRAAIGFSIGNQGYAGTGFDGTTRQKDFWEYDPATNTWTQKTDFGGTGRHSAVGFSVGSKGYVGTGYDGAYVKDFWEYDPTVNIWVQKANLEGELSWGRSAAVGFSIGSKGYVGLGFRQGTWGTYFFYADFYEYDPQSNTWTLKALFMNGRYEAVGFGLGNKGYVGLGLSVMDSPVYYKDFWEYDPGADTWTQKADWGDTTDPLETGRSAGIGFSIGGMGYVGMGFDGSVYHKDFWEYDAGVDTIPDPFAFTDQTDVALNTLIESDAITVSGLGTGATAFISITGGEYSVNGGSYRSDESTVSNGDRIKVRLTSSANYSTKTSLTLFIGGLSDDFSVTTIAAPSDRTPDPFAFIDRIDVPLNTIVTSNTITVSGITTATPITITGGNYSVNGATYTSEVGTVDNGDKVTVQLVSSASYSTTTYATLTIGGVSDTFSATTQAFTLGEGCFIATAAFGSPMAGQVDILRQFRDSYLLTNAFGRKFVAWYYRNGKIAAQYIKDKPLAKMLIRVGLYPLIGFSFLLVTGYLPFITAGILLSALIFLRLRSKILKNKRCNTA